MTRELIATPSPENWIWRISVAEVASAGAFSDFAGVQRWLAILKGSGVRLSMPTALVELTPSTDPLAFDGATPIHCSLLKGPVQDLNLMLRGDDNTASMQRVGGTQCLSLVAAKIVAIYSADSPVYLRCANSACVIPKETLAWQLLPAGTELMLETNHAVLMQIATVAATPGTLVSF